MTKQIKSTVLPVREVAGLGEVSCVCAVNNKGKEYQLPAAYISHTGNLLPFEASKAWNDFCRETGFKGSDELKKTHRTECYAIWQNIFCTVSSIASSQDKKDKEVLKIQAKARLAKGTTGFRVNETYNLPDLDNSDLTRVTVQLALARAQAQARKDKAMTPSTAQADAARSQERAANGQPTVTPGLPEVTGKQTNGKAKVSPLAAKLAADAASAIASALTVAAK